MHFEDYHKSCSNCDRPIQWEVLGREIIVTPCPCQVTELIKACQRWDNALKSLMKSNPSTSLYRSLYETHGMANIRKALANATK